MLSDEGKFSIECLRAQTTRMKIPVLALFFLVPITGVGQYLNPHISAESLRMKTSKLPYFILTSRRLIFRSQKHFLRPSSPQTVTMTS